VATSKESNRSAIVRFNEVAYFRSSRRC